MKVLALPQRVFDELMRSNNTNDKNVESKTKIALISIVDTRGFDKHFFKENHSNVLNLEFDDIEKDIQQYKTMSVEQGRQVVSFLKNIDKDNVEYLLVHCAAGISRSGAIATFANEFFELDNEVFKKDNHYIYPNGNVLRILHSLIRNEMDE